MVCLNYLFSYRNSLHIDGHKMKKKYKYNIGSLIMLIYATISQN